MIAFSPFHLSHITPSKNKVVCEEYTGGYLAEPPFDFFGAAPTPAGVAHLRRRKLPAMYAGGLWARVMGSPDAVATTMDRMLLGPDGYWIYKDFPGGNVLKNWIIQRSPRFYLGSVPDSQLKSWATEKLDNST